MKRIVRCPVCRRVACARAISSLISLMPDSTALKATKRACVRSAISRAMVVLPVPGGPQKISDCSDVGLDRLAQRRARREHGLLADDLVERARPHALGQRRVRASGCGRGGGVVVVGSSEHEATEP